MLSSRSDIREGRPTSGRGALSVSTWAAPARGEVRTTLRLEPSKDIPSQIPRSPDPDPDAGDANSLDLTGSDLQPSGYLRRSADGVRRRG